MSAPLVVYLKSKTSGFKISNISILKGVIQLACDAAQSLGKNNSDDSLESIIITICYFKAM